MNIRQLSVPVVAAVLLCFAMCFPSWTVVASAHEASFKLTEQSLDALRKEGLPKNTLEKLKALKGKEFNTKDEFLKAVGQTIGNNQTVRYKAQILKQGAAEKNEIKQLEQRVKDLEAAETAREEATRSIIRDALSTVGSKINESVTLGGTLEVTAGRANDFNNKWEYLLGLSTVELDFEIDVNDWTMAGLIIEYEDGTNITFPTTSGFETNVDRINLDTAFLTIGDPQRFPPFMTAGQIVLPFGISTGDPVADVLSIEDPLTIEAFEFREVAVGIGLGFPTPALRPATPPVTPPPVRPLVINPLISSLSKFVGYKPPATPPPAPTPVTPAPAPPLFNLGIYSYNGETYRNVDDEDWEPKNTLNATAGFRTQGDHLFGADFYPWSIDVDVDYNSSIFDSRFLGDQYEAFLGQIDFVPGMAAHLKSTLGPVSLIGEWNGAISRATFTDGLGNRVSIKPIAWQVSLGYQFDWNPWVEVIGAQGNYLTVGYSESKNLMGVKQLIDGELNRVGFVPRRRFIVGVGEWVLDNLRLALEYSINKDYSDDDGGTSDVAQGFFAQITVVW